MAEQPLLSIIITSYTMERMRDISELLESVKKQAYPRIETIFVAERSKELCEGVKACAREKDLPDVVVVFNDGESGLSAARNLGIKHARGDIIAFVKTVGGVKPVEQATIQDIDVAKYKDLVRSTFEQVLDALGIEWFDTIGMRRLDTFFG